MSRAAVRQASTFSIGEVLAKLRPEFPDVTISKIRFLESEGLIEPERTPAGYRKFSHEHVARLRYVLSAQRDHFLPLRVIREHLEALDEGHEPPHPGGVVVIPRVVQAGEEFPQPVAFGPDEQKVRLSREELVEAADVTSELVEQLEAFGLITPVPGSDRYDGDALVICKIAGEMMTYGLEPRHLRTFKTAADREIGLFDQVVAVLERSPAAGGRARADEVTRELAALSVRLHATLVRTGLARHR